MLALDRYQQWVEAYARNHRIPIEWPDAEVLKTKKMKKEDYVRPYGARMERRQGFGVYFIFKSLEQGPKFGIRHPKYPTDDPHYRIVSRQRSRYTHYYFYIRDEVLGPLVMCVGSFLPFQTTYYLNGHHIIAGDLQRRGLVGEVALHDLLVRAGRAEIGDVGEAQGVGEVAEAGAQAAAEAAGGAGDQDAAIVGHGVTS